MKILSLLIISLLFTGCTQLNLPENNINNKKNSTSTKNIIQKEENSDFEFEIKNNESIQKDSNKVKYEKLPNFNNTKDKENLVVDNVSSNITNKKSGITFIDEDTVQISVEEIPVTEFINMVYSNILKLNYSVSNNVKKLKNTITFNMNEPQTKSEFYEVVKKLLDTESINITEENNVLFLDYELKRNRKAKDEVTLSNNIVFGRILPKNIDDNENISIFIPYYYISPFETYKVLKSSGLKDLNQSNISKNLQLLMGPVNQIKQALVLINLLDKPSFQNYNTYLIELENINSEKFYKRIKEIFETNNINVANDTNDVGVILKEISEINSLLVLTSNKKWLDMVLYWKDKLDVLSEVTTEAQFYMYKVNYRKADELAQTLNSIIKFESLSTSENSNIKQLNINNQNNNNATTNNQIANTKNTVNSTNTTNYKKNIIADLHTNTIMMQLVPSDYKKLLPLIKKLDALPLQVLVEVTLAEVSMNDGFDLGFEWEVLNSKAASVTTIDLPNNYLATTIGAAGITASYFKNNITSIINAYAKNQVLDIISKPKLVILNNETGKINVGQDVPVVTSESSETDVQNSILRNVSYQSTGVIVSLTPTINSNGTLTMNIQLNLSEAQTNNTSNIDSPLIVNRELTTTSVMKSDETVILGGLISKNKSTTNGGVPLLKDLPFLGNLFKSKSDSITKTELIMLIKPKILTNSEDMIAETIKYKEILSTIKEIQ